ncbi:hypothetical protein IGI04_030363 [Brassica rapa subsp. trilocularis]|uniref:Phosphoprotein n=1 Tax=Brassica rapa subsp. trilocularis TaxID=1813537 RepID=A0ABQ7LQJ2_BRACM|nr:hypothetical protein IGI04_030363 [Brassica rapa subsp. trilocularis]
MENIERDQPSIDGNTFPSSDDESEESTDTESPTSIDTAQPEAGKYSLTKPANEKVVQTELNGQTSNETSQTKQGTEIPVKENSTLTKGEDIKLSIQDYLDPGRTYSNRSAIKIPGDDTKKSKFNADYYRMIDENALSDTDDYSDEETNCSDPYYVFHVESFTQAYDTALKSHSLGELIRKLEGQVAEIATAIKRDAGCLPGRTDLNLRRQVSAVMLRSEKNLAADTRNNSDVGKPDDADETGKSNSHPVFLDELDPNPSQDNRKTTTEKAKEKAIDLELEEDTEIEDEIDRQYGTDVDRPKTPTIDQQPEKPIDRRTDDYMQLMDASIDVANIEENDDSEVVIDRYLQDTVDRQPPSHDAARLVQFIDKTIRLKLLSVKGTGHKHFEESLMVWFGSR